MASPSAWHAPPALMSTPAPPSLNLNRVAPLAFGLWGPAAFVSPGPPSPLLSCPLARPHRLLLYPYFFPCEGKEMQQSKAYWQLAAPAGQHNGSSSCIFRASSLALCASMQSGNAVHAVSGDHFVPSMNKLHILRWAWKKVTRSSLLYKPSFHFD